MTNGLHNGALYALLAYGYVLTYSVTHRANIAHGAVFAFSGQMLVLAATIGYSSLWMTLTAALLFGITSAIIASSLVLIILGKIIFPPLILRAPNTMIAATLGVSIVLMEGARLTANTRDYWLPPLLSNQINFSKFDNAPSLTLLQVINLCLIALIIAIVQTTLTRSSMGRILRAVSDDAAAASLVGINVPKTITIAIFSGGALAAFAGMLSVLYFGNMSFGAGIVFGLKVLFIAAAGGFSIPLRASIGAFLFGEAEALWDGYLPILWREPVFYSVLALMLCLRTENQLHKV